MTSPVLLSRLPENAGDFNWPADRRFRQVPPAGGRPGYTVRNETIEFSADIQFLRLNEAIVVLAPLECLADWTEPMIHRAEVAREMLEAAGLYVVKGAMRLEICRRAERRYPTTADWAWAIVRRSIEADVAGHDETSFETMMTMIEATPDTEHSILFRDLEQIFRREGPYRVARDLDDSRNVRDPLVRMFYQELGRLLYVVNGNFRRINLPAPVEAVAMEQFRARYGWD